MNDWRADLPVLWKSDRGTVYGVELGRNHRPVCLAVRSDGHEVWTKSGLDYAISLLGPSAEVVQLSLFDEIRDDEEGDDS